MKIRNPDKFLAKPLKPFIDNYTAGVFHSEIIKPLWLCGGALVRLLRNEPMSDYDLVGGHQAQREMISRLKLTYSRSETHRAITFKRIVTGDDNPSVIQIVKGDTAAYPDAYLDYIFDDFDITVCQLATDGETLFGTPQAFEDLEKGQFRLTEQGKITASATNLDIFNPFESWSRCWKYFLRGLTPIGFASALVDSTIGTFLADNLGRTNSQTLFYVEDMKKQMKHS